VCYEILFLELTRNSRRIVRVPDLVVRHPQQVLMTAISTKIVFKTFFFNFRHILFLSIWTQLSSSFFRWLVWAQCPPSLHPWQWLRRKAKAKANASIIDFLFKQINYYGRRTTHVFIFHCDFCFRLKWSIVNNW
jgi:hypothetical protein